MILEFASGAQRIRGAFHAPDGSATHPGVVVIPDVRGLSDHYDAVAQRLAAAGFVALALDPYTRGENPDTSSPETTFKFMRELSDVQVLDDVQAAIDCLRARAEVGDKPIGLTGFCMGGKYAMLAACRCRGLSAAAAWYGMLRVDGIDERNPEHPLDALERLSCPLLALFGAEDPIVPRADVAELEQRVARAGLDIEVVSYPGAGHAFANDTRPDAYRPEAAEDAWGRVTALFARHLGP